MSSSVVLINSVNIFFHSFLLKLKTLENSLLRDQMIFSVFGNSSHGVTFIIIGKVEDMLELLTELDCCPAFLIICNHVVPLFFFFGLENNCRILNCRGNVVQCSS